MFSGIGGLDLGLEWGIKDAETVWQIEMEPFGRSILAKHWPDADRSVTDVRNGNAENLAPVDLISGGFPCQDISIGGNQKGFDGDRSSLWHEMARIIGDIRPKYIVLENVAGITSLSMQRVLGRVLSDVAAMGYSGEWHRISAAQVGAPHRRRRWFFIGFLANTDGKHDQTLRRERPNISEKGTRWPNDGARGAGDVERKKPILGAVPDSSHATKGRVTTGETHWQIEPQMGRVVDGLSKRLARRNRSALTALGNAVVPQCAELVGRRVQEIREILDNE